MWTDGVTAVSASCSTVALHCRSAYGIVNSMHATGSHALNSDIKQLMQWITMNLLD